MRLSEIVKKPESQKPSNNESGVGLTQFREDDDIDPELRELCDNLVGLTSSTQARTILSLYFPQYFWGGIEV